MNAIVYRRVSTDHQDNSMGLQEEVSMDYCRKHGFVVFASFSDDDTSGCIPLAERKGGSALLVALANPAARIKHLVTAKQDRLGRDTLDQITVIRNLWEVGITPHFASEGGAVPRSAQNEFMFEVKASAAQYERHLIRDRTRAAIRSKRERGHLVGNVPYGYDAIYVHADGYRHTANKALTDTDLTPMILAHGKVSEKLIVGNPAEQNWIRTIAVWRWGSNLGAWLAGQKFGPAGEKLATADSLKIICARLAAAGCKAKQGNPWQPGNLDGMLGSMATKRLLLSDTEPPALEQAA